MKKFTLKFKLTAVNITAKTVLKLMREIGIRCKIKGKRYQSYIKGRGRHTALNLMARDFSAAHPNEKWVTDVTEFKVAKQKLFLSPVMDLFNREIITWTVNTSPTYSLVQTMLRQALTQLLEGKKVILHSDSNNVVVSFYHHACCFNRLVRSLMQ